VRTQQSYTSSVAALARYHRCSPDRLEPDAVAAYFRHLVLERSLSPASCLVHLHGIRFFYLKVLERAHFDIEVVIPKHAGIPCPISPHAAPGPGVRPPARLPHRGTGGARAALHRLRLCTGALCLVP